MPLLPPLMARRSRGSRAPARREAGIRCSSIVGFCCIFSRCLAWWV